MALGYARKDTRAACKHALTGSRNNKAAVAQLPISDFHLLHVSRANSSEHSAVPTW